MSAADTVNVGKRDVEKPRLWAEYGATFAVCISALSVGCVLGWTGNVAEDLQVGNFHELEMDDYVFSWVASLPTLGAFFMSIPVGKLSDMCGRKRCMLISMAPCILGWCAIIFGQSLFLIYLGRFLTGMSMGAFAIVAPQYTNEIALPKRRGILGAFYHLFVTVGILISYTTGHLCEVHMHTLICMIFPIFFICLFTVQPESPVYLLKIGQEDKAYKVLRKLRGKKYDVNQELEKTRLYMERCYRKAIFLEVICNRPAVKAQCIVYVLFALQHLSGYSILILYSSKRFLTNRQGMDPKLISIIVASVQVLASSICAALIDRLGRKKLLIISCVFMCLSNFGLAIFSTFLERKFADLETIHRFSAIPLVCKCTFIVAFCFGLGPVPYVLCSEMFPPDVKAVMNSGAGMVCWGLAFIMTKYYLPLRVVIEGDVSFYIFAISLLLGTIFIIAVVFETKNLPLSEILVLLKGKKKALKADGRFGESFQELQEDNR